MHLQGYILDTGTLANTNYLAIPVNAPSKVLPCYLLRLRSSVQPDLPPLHLSTRCLHQPAALVVANYLANPAAMFFRFQNISALQVFDPTVSAFTTGGWNTAFDSIPNAPQVRPLSLPFLSTSWLP
jgi:hypothetical protein